MNYPTLDLALLQQLLPLKEQIDVSEKFLEDAPYAPELKATLKALFATRVETVVGMSGSNQEAGKRGRKRKDGGITDDQAEMIEIEANALLKELKELKPPTGGKFDHDTKIQIIKAKTALIEKVVNIQERAFNVRKVSTFQKLVIDILGDLVDPDKIKEFQDRLGIYL